MHTKYHNAPVTFVFSYLALELQAVGNYTMLHFRSNYSHNNPSCGRTSARPASWPQRQLSAGLPSASFPPQRLSCAGEPTDSFSNKRSRCPAWQSNTVTVAVLRTHLHWGFREDSGEGESRGLAEHLVKNAHRHERLTRVQGQREGECVQANRTREHTKERVRGCMY